MKPIASFAITLGMLFACVGCGGSNNSQQPTPSSLPIPSTTLTNPTLQPPVQPPRINPKIVYDPCTWIPDNVIAAAGYNPASRRRKQDYIPREDDPRDNATAYWICQFRDNANGPTKEKFVLDLLSTNANYTTERNRRQATGYGSQVIPLTVNGRAGFEFRGGLDISSCVTYLATKAGFIEIARYTLGAGPKDVCQGIVELTKLIEPTIRNQ